MKRIIPTSLLAASFSFAQIIGPPNPLPNSLATYLDLTATQNARLQQNRVTLQQFLNEKARREATVRAELAIETRKPVLDPMALGVRYVELEAICRESLAATDRSRADNLALLTDPQRAKLRSLVEVINLIPVVAEAQAINLLPGTVGGFGAFPMGATTGMIGGIIGDLLPSPIRTGAPGCSAGGFGSIIGLPGGILTTEQKQQ